MCSTPETVANSVEFLVYGRGTLAPELTPDSAIAQIAIYAEAQLLVAGYYETLSSGAPSPVTFIL
jgi:hypothetical protein